MNFIMKDLLALHVGLLALAMPAAPVLAAGFRVETVALGLVHPWSQAFLPGGRLLVTERPGGLRLMEPGPDGRPSCAQIRWPVCHPCWR
jgi:aldose sugar dehydrogenase